MLCSKVKRGVGSRENAIGALERSTYRRRLKESPAETGPSRSSWEVPDPRGHPYLGRPRPRRLYRIDHHRKIDPDRATGRDFRNPPPVAASSPARRSAPLGPVASSGALRAFLAASIGQVPWILDAEPAAATCCHHALLERGEGAGGAVIAVVAAVLDAPGPVDSAAAGWASIASAADASTANATRVMIMAVLVNSPRRFEHRVRIVVLVSPVENTGFICQKCRCDGH